MTRKRAILHLGMIWFGHEALRPYADLLADTGHVLLPASADELRCAQLEMLRRHREAGLRRRDVEGTWAGLVRRARRTRQHVVIDGSAFIAATDPQIALILDELAGLHPLVAITCPEEEDPEPLVAAWSRHLRPSRIHVRPVPEDAAPVDVAEELAGLGIHLGRQADVRAWPFPRAA